MIRDSAKGQFSFVITWKNDRFSRSRYDSAIYKHRLKQNGVRILYAKETIPEGPEGIILESVMEGFAEYYSANLSQNIKRGNTDSALKRQTLGQVLLGLRKGPDNRFELDPATAPVVRRIFEEYAGGRSAVDIYTDLNAEGFRTIRGNLFNKNSIRRILQNEKYVGVYEWGDIRDEEGIPPIVDRALFDKAQKVMDRHRRSPASKKSDGGFLLTAKLFCGECGEPMTGDGGTGRSGQVYSYYICNGRRKKRCNKARARKEWIEDIVVAQLAEIVHDDDMINEFADRFMAWQSKEKETGALNGLEQRLKTNEAAIKNTLSAIDSGLITDSLKSHLIELEEERAALETGIAKAKMETPELERDHVVWFLERFRDGDQRDPEWRIFLVETFLQAAYLYDDGRLLLQLNYGGPNNTVSLELAEQVVDEGDVLGGSSFAPNRPPNKVQPLI